MCQNLEMATIGAHAAYFGRFGSAYPKELPVDVYVQCGIVSIAKFGHLYPTIRNNPADLATMEAKKTTL